VSLPQIPQTRWVSQWNTLILVRYSPTSLTHQGERSQLRLLMADLIRAMDPQQLEECWRSWLDEIRRHYEEERRPETKMEYLRALQQFTDLVLRGKCKTSSISVPGSRQAPIIY
jgi:hypothetical protein